MGNDRYVYGQLHIAAEVKRNQYAQSKSGGKLRREDDHGGHLIAAMFGGDPTEKNLFPKTQN